METYLPAQLTDAELEEIVRELVANQPEPTNQGRLMGQVMKTVAGRADGARVQNVLKSILAN